LVWLHSSWIFNVHEHRFPAHGTKITFRQRVFVGWRRTVAPQVQRIQSIGIEDGYAAIIELDFFGLSVGFVAVVGVLPSEAGLIVDQTVRAMQAQFSAAKP
jgi:hypothetical protein